MARSRAGRALWRSARSPMASYSVTPMDSGGLATRRLAHRLFPATACPSRCIRRGSPRNILPRAMTRGRFRRALPRTSRRKCSARRCFRKCYCSRLAKRPAWPPWNGCRHCYASSPGQRVFRKTVLTRRGPALSEPDVSPPRNGTRVYFKARSRNSILRARRIRVRIFARPLITQSLRARFKSFKT